MKCADVMRDYSRIPAGTLVAPFKQAVFLLGLLMPTKEPQKPKKLSEGRWDLMCRLLQKIFGQYARMFFPQEGEDPQEESWALPRSVAMPTFLHYFTSTRVYASVEQLENRLSGLFGHFDDELKTELGLSANHLMIMIQDLTSLLQERMDDVRARYQSKFYSSLLTATMPEFLSHSISLDGLLTVEYNQLEKMWGQESASLFWQTFVSIRGATKEISYLTEISEIEKCPMLQFSEGKAICPMGNALYYAAQIWFEESLLGGTHRDRFLKRRDLFLESRVVKAFRGIFDQNALFFPQEYERDDSSLEHDLVMVNGRSLFLVEAKAGSVREPFRDPDRAYPRILTNFRQTIQEGYEQARRIRQRLQSHQSVELFDRNGVSIATLKPEDFDDIFCICVTADCFGPLATDLALLEKEGQEEYPWVVTYYDLESFADALQYRGWSHEQLCDYLKARLRLYGLVATGDELDIAGIFITHESLDVLLEAEADKIAMDGSTSQVFDDIWLEKNGGPKADLSPGTVFVNPIWNEPSVRDLFPFLPDGL